MYNVEKIELPEGLYAIPPRMLEYSKIKSITLPSTVTKIYSSAFKECSNLEKIVLPEGVTEIHENAFFDCEKLRKIYVPESVTTLGNAVFLNDYNLSEIYYGGSEEQWKQISVGSSNSNLEKCKIFFNCSAEVLNYELGDINMDDKLNVRDATAIQKYLAKMTQVDETQLILADYNGDLKVNVKDATTIQKKIAGLDI